MPVEQLGHEDHVAGLHDHAAQVWPSCPLTAHSLGHDAQACTASAILRHNQSLAVQGHAARAGYCLPELAHLAAEVLQKHSCSRPACRAARLVEVITNGAPAQAFDDGRPPSRCTSTQTCLVAPQGCCLEGGRGQLRTWPPRVVSIGSTACQVAASSACTGALTKPKLQA